MIHIIADSTSAIPQEMLSKYSTLHVIPLSLSIKGEYIPENEATIRQVIEYSEKINQAIPTSQPSTGDFLNAFNLIPEKMTLLFYASQLQSVVHTMVRFWLQNNLEGEIYQ